MEQTFLRMSLYSLLGSGNILGFQHPDIGIMNAPDPGSPRMVVYRVPPHYGVRVEMYQNDTNMIRAVRTFIHMLSLVQRWKKQ